MEEVRGSSGAETSISSPGALNRLDFERNAHIGMQYQCLLSPAILMLKFQVYRKIFISKKSLDNCVGWWWNEQIRVGTESFADPKRGYNKQAMS